MPEFDSQPTAAPPGLVADFAVRPASMGWEQIPLVEFPQHAIWAWFKPVNAPHTAILRVPDETFATISDRRYLTMRRLLVSVSIDPRAVMMWNFCGAGYDAMGGTSPLLDHPLPNPPIGGDPNITVFCAVPMMPTAPQMAPAVSAEAATPTVPNFKGGGPLSDVFENIDVNWAAILQIEKNMAGIRKQLSSMLSRLNSLNRDLGPEERLHADRQDRSDWQVARRWLRDVAKRVSQCLKTYDIGEHADADQRARFEQIYEQNIVPRKAFDGMEQVQREFESHRKTVQTIMMTMNTALQTATQDGERRAQQTLNKIARAVRAAKSKR